MPRIHFRNLVLLFIIFCLGACGFQVIYKDHKEGNATSYVEELAAVRIKKNRTHLDQTLKNNLYDLLNPDYIKVEPKYFLELKISRTLSSTFISSTGASGRNKVTLLINYELKNLETAAIISVGSTTVNDNYDVTSNRYGTYSAENYVDANLTKIAAQNIRNSLVNDFIETRKKCQFQIKVDKYFLCPLGNKIDR